VVPVAGSATVDSTLLEPASPEISPGPAVPATPAVPAAAPKPTRKVQPVYPDRPLDLEKEGDVVVAIAVGAGGVVTDADIVSEDPQGYGFGKAALAAVRRWEFATATPGTYTVTVKFRLD
jgi:protein TonB